MDVNFIRFAYVDSSQHPFSTSGNKSHSLLSGLEEDSTVRGNSCPAFRQKRRSRVLPASGDSQFLSFQNHPHAKVASFDMARPGVLH